MYLTLLFPSTRMPMESEINNFAFTTFQLIIFTKRKHESKNVNFISCFRIFTFSFSCFRFVKIKR